MFDKDDFAPLNKFLEKINRRADRVKSALITGKLPIDNYNPSMHKKTFGAYSFIITPSEDLEKYNFEKKWVKSNRL